MHAESLDNDETVKDVAELLLSVQYQVGDWSKWLKRSKESKRTPLRKLLSPRALYWGLPTRTVIHLSTIARLMQLKPKSSKTDEFGWDDAIQQWIESTKSCVTEQVALESVAWAYALPALSSHLSETDWQRLAASLFWIAQPKATECDNAMASFLLLCETNMALAYSLPDMKIAKERAVAGRRAFERLLDEFLDGEGMPHTSHLDSIQWLLASCTRVLKLDGEIKKGRVDKASRLQYDWLARQTLRWSRPDGTSIFSEDGDAPHFDELFKFVLKQTRDESDAAALRLLRGKRKSSADDIPSPTEHSEWSELATMRTVWQSSAARLAVRYPRNVLNAELAVGQQVVFSGNVMPSIQVEGSPLHVESAWEEVCWETDDDMDYMELECELSDDWKIQRQFLLARRDMFAFTADVLLGPKVSSVKYHRRLPLVEGVLLEQPDETTEAMILGDKQLGTVIPISLPEWRSAQRESRLRVEPARLEITTRARSLYAPLFFDLDPARRRKALTWRQLTVAEELQPVSPEVAVAYRVQVGKKQWVIYRSLDKPGNRTFLGQNLISEFLVARFKSDGEIEPLIDVTG